MALRDFRHTLRRPGDQDASQGAERGPMSIDAVDVRAARDCALARHKARHWAAARGLLRFRLGMPLEAPCPFLRLYRTFIVGLLVSHLHECRRCAAAPSTPAAAGRHKREELRQERSCHLMPRECASSALSAPSDAPSDAPRARGAARLHPARRHPEPRARGSIGSRALLARSCWLGAVGSG